MRALGIGLAMALALSSIAHADDETDSGRAWTSPPFAVLHDRWPREADGSLIYGRVFLDCGVGPGGYAADCRVKSSEPHDPRLEQAALQLAGLYRSTGGKTGRLPLVASVKFDTPPGWLRKPSAEHMGLLYPRRGAAKGVPGQVLVKCVVNQQGLTQACSVLEETPTGRGFAEATLKLTNMFLFKPATRKGEPVESDVTIPINWMTDRSFVLPNAVVIDMPAWSKAPDVSEILGQLDRKVGDKFADGKIIFMCDLNKATGRMDVCTIANQSPGMTQFSDVARALSQKFQADPKSLADLQAWLGPTKTEAIVLVPFAFPDMASPAWGKRYVTHVLWARGVYPTPGHPLFPEEAAKAGLKEGEATVDCQIAADGVVSQCVVESESTPGVGFGAMAKSIAEAGIANRWTEEGLPVEGARIKMPVKMTYDEKFAKPAKP